MAAFHRIVLVLAQQHNYPTTPSPVYWEELLAALATKHPDLSLAKLRPMVTAHPSLFNVGTNGALCLRQQNCHLLVQQYFELAENVEVVTAATTDLNQYHMSEVCQVKVACNTLIVRCTGSAEVARTGVVGGVLFQFGDQVVAYRLPAPGKKTFYCHAQVLLADLHIRKVVRSTYDCLILFCF